MALFTSKLRCEQGLITDDVRLEVIEPRASPVPG